MADEKTEQLQEAREGVEQSEFFRRIVGGPIDDADGEAKAKEGEGAEETEEVEDHAPKLPPIPSRKKAPAAKKSKTKTEEEKEEPPPPPQQVDLEAVAEAAGRGVAKVLGQKPAPAAAAASKDPFDDLPPEFKKKAELYRTLTKIDPRKYTPEGLVADLKGFQAKEAKYRKDWESEHEGERFDSNSDDHRAFYEENAPSVDTDDIEAAKEAMLLEKAEKRVGAKYEGELKKLNQQKRIGEVANAVGAVYATMLTGAVSDLTGEKKPDISPEALNKLGQEDPILGDAMLAVIPAYRRKIEVALAVLNNVIDYDDRNPEHIELADRITKIETDLASRPAAETAYERDDGTKVRFVTSDRYQTMTPSERAGAWTLDGGYVARWIAEEGRDEVKKTKEAIDRKWEAIAKARGFEGRSSQNGSASRRSDSSQESGRSGSAPVLRRGQERGQPIGAGGKKSDEASRGISLFLKNIGVE